MEFDGVRPGRIFAGLDAFATKKGPETGLRAAGSIYELVSALPDGEYCDPFAAYPGFSLNEVPTMTKSRSAQSFSLLGVIFMIVGALTLIIAIMNYFQDGRISLTIVFGLMGISLGALLVSQGKKSRAQDE